MRRKMITKLLVAGILGSACAGAPKAAVEPQSREEVASAVEPSDLEGSWEGVLEGTRAPIFTTLHLERMDGELGGSVVFLGRTIRLKEVTPTGQGVRAVLAPGPKGVYVEATLAGDRLTGSFVERELRLPLELHRVPEYPAPADRAEAWGQDLDALAHRFLRVDGSFSPAQRALFLEQIDEVRSRVPGISDSEIMMRMAAAVSLSGNAHTRLYLLRNRTELRRLPVRLWWFLDGLYVVRATARHRDLVGCRVDDIAGMPARLVRDSVAAAFAGNPSWTDYKSVYFMTSPEALYGFGITRDVDRVEIGLSQCGQGPLRSVLEPLPLVRSQDPVEAWWDLSPHHRDSDWVQVLEGFGENLPLYLRHPDRYYWFDYLPETGLLYFQYNRSSNMSDESTQEFAERLLAEFKSRDVKAFVLDLRFNTGGNLSLGRDLMTKLQEATADIPRFVITGRATFSAGITHVASWKAAGNVTIVGEDVGDDLDFWSEGGNIILPNSRLAAHFANAFHSYSERPCPDGVPCFLDMSSPDLRPEIPVSSSWADYIGGVDVAMEAVRAAVHGPELRE